MSQVILVIDSKFKLILLFKVISSILKEPGIENSSFK